MKKLIYSFVLILAPIISQAANYSIGSMNSDSGSSSSQVGATSACESSPSGLGRFHLDCRASANEGVASGGTMGDHSYSISTQRNYLDILAGDSDIALSAGANVVVNADGDYAKSIAGNSWNSWFKSSDVVFDPGMIDAMVSWEIESTTGTIREMGCLDDNPDANASYSSGDYCIYQVSASQLYIYEKAMNVYRHAISLSVGDRLGIQSEDGVVKYFHLRGNVSTAIFTSQTKASTPLSFKGVLNRGSASSGAAVMGDIKLHDFMVSRGLGVRVLGAATAEVSDDDKAKLSTIGLTVDDGALYSMITAEKITNSRFLSGMTYSISHGYSVSPTQTTMVITP